VSSPPPSGDRGAQPRPVKGFPLFSALGWPVGLMQPLGAKDAPDAMTERDADKPARHGRGRAGRHVWVTAYVLLPQPPSK